MLGVNEWLMWLIHSMYENARISMCVGWNLSEEFSVKVSGRQMLARALYCSSRFWKPPSKVLQIGYPWGDLNTDDPVIISESLEKMLRVSQRHRHKLHFPQEAISHHLSRKSWKSLLPELRSPCKRRLDPNLIWSASPAMH